MPDTSSTATAPPPKYSQDARAIAIQTTLGKDALLLRTLRGEEGISRLFRFDLDLLSDQQSVDIASIIGKAATVGIRLGDGNSRYLNGIISRIVLMGAEGRFTVYRAELVPWTWLLTRTSDCRVFQNMTIPAIVESVFKSLGFQDYANRLQQVYPQREFTVQYRETDFNFVSRLLEQVGIFYFFEHENGKHTFVMADASTEHRPNPGLAQARFRAVAPNDYEADVISGWSVAHELRPAKYSLAAFNFETPNTDLNVTVDSVHVPEGAAKYEIYDYPGDYQKRDDGDTLVGLRIEEQETQLVTVRGAGTCRALVSGCRFDLTDHPHKDVNQTYVVTAVSHAVSEPSYLPKDNAPDGRYRNTFTAIPFSVPFRPPRVTPRPVIHGVQTAIVVGKSGEEIWTDKYGRVKVQFHWDRQGNYDENSSCWIRVSQNWAGKRWGAMFLPRMGQEVIVEFLEGDPDFPIITGRVYNGDQTPPYDLPDDQTKTTLKTLSSKGGGGFNELRFEDKKGSEQIFIHGQKDLDFVVEAESRELVLTDRHFIAKQGRFEQIGQEQHLKTGGDFVKDIGGAEYLQAKDSLYVKTGAKVMLEAGGELTLKAPGGFIVIGADGITIQGKLVNINSGGTVGTTATKAVKLPHRASSAGIGGIGIDGTPGTTTTQDPDLTRVDLYQKAYDDNSSKLSDQDKKDYLAAMAELRAATARHDPQAIAAAQAKLDAILKKNGIPIPPDPAKAAATSAGAVAGQNTALAPTRLHTDGPIFRTEDGLPWRWHGVTAFMLLKQHLDGQDVTPFLNFAAGVGANLVRILGMASNLLPLRPQDYGDRFWTGLTSFVDLCAAQHFFVEYTVFADAQIVMPDNASQQAHWAKAIAAIRDKPNVVVELANEYSKNGVDPSKFARPGAPVVASRGSGCGGDLPFVPAWDFLTDHPERKAEWPRTAKNLQEWNEGTPTFSALRIPCVADEPMGAAETDQPGRRSAIPDDFFWFAATAALMGAGATFHFDDGLATKIPGPVQDACARSFFAGLDAIPLEAPKGQYTRGLLADCPLAHDDAKALRTFARISGGNATAVVIRPTAAWSAVAQLGWTIVGQRGPRGTVIDLKK